MNKEGLIHPTDSAHAVDFHKQVTEELKTNLLKNASVKASATRGKAFAVKNLTDDNFDTYWATPDGVTTATLEISLKKTQKLNRLMLREYIPLGQRVKKFSVEYLDGKQWFVTIPDEEKEFTRYDIDSLEDLYDHADKLIAIAKFWHEQG